jgi:flagellar biosynthesis chaperone FliJ
MASPTETPSWERESRCGCKGCAVARKEGEMDAGFKIEQAKQLQEFVQNLSQEVDRLSGIIFAVQKALDESRKYGESIVRVKAIQKALRGE